MQPDNFQIIMISALILTLHLALFCFLPQSALEEIFIFLSPKCFTMFTTQSHTLSKQSYDSKAAVKGEMLMRIVNDILFLMSPFTLRVDI